MFASLSYNYNIITEFDDLDTNPNTLTPGEINLGNSWLFGVGMGIALNNRASFTLSFSQNITEESQTRALGGDWQKIRGSSGNAATLSLATNVSWSRNLSMTTNLSLGLTSDASDMIFSINFPYTF